MLRHPHVPLPLPWRPSPPSLAFGPLAARAAASKREGSISRALVSPLRVGEWRARGAPRGTRRCATLFQAHCAYGGSDGVGVEGGLELAEHFVGHIGQVTFVLAGNQYASRATFERQLQPLWQVAHSLQQAAHAHLARDDRCWLQGAMLHTGPGFGQRTEEVSKIGEVWLLFFYYTVSLHSSTQSRKMKRMSSRGGEVLQLCAFRKLCMKWRRSLP